MLLRRFTDFILASRWQGLLAAFLIAFLPLVGSVSILIMALVTLRKGVFEGALVLFVAVVPSVLLYAAYPPSTDIEQFASFEIVESIASSVLIWLFAVMLRRYGNWNFTLELAAFLGIMAIAVVQLAFPDLQDWWQKQLIAYLTKTTTMIGASKPDADVAIAQAQMIEMVKYYTTVGFKTAYILFNALLQLVIARWWQAAMFNPGGLRKELYQIRLSTLAGVVFAVALILYYWGIELASDIMPVLFLTFCAAGLSVLHYLIAPASISWLLLALMYVAIIWMYPVSVVIVSLIALVDTAINIRQKVSRLT